MSQRSLEVFYEPNRRLAHAHDLQGYNAGYAEARGVANFDQYQKDLVWRLLGDVEIGPESTVLDVGCGIGGPSGWIYERYHPERLIGIEYCSTSVRTAEERWTGKPQRPIFLQGDAHCLPVPDQSVDVIFNLESALHYADKRKFISECLRALKPGGVLCLGDITTRCKKTFAVLGTLNLLTSQFSTHARLWDAPDYLETFESIGFQLIRHERVTRQSADSLRDGLDEVSRGSSWSDARGYRGRFFYLWFMERLLRHRLLNYDLFALAKPRGGGTS